MNAREGRRMLQYPASKRAGQGCYHPGQALVVVVAEMTRRGL
jgi:hypothetical protein